MRNDPDLLANLRAACDSALDAASRVYSVRGIVDRVEPAIETTLSIDLAEPQRYDIERVRSASRALAEVVLDVLQPEVDLLTDRADLVDLDSTPLWLELIEGLSNAEVDYGMEDDTISFEDARFLDEISSRILRLGRTSLDAALALENSVAEIILLLLNDPYEIVDSGGPNDAPRD